LLGFSGLTFSGKGIQKVSLQSPEGRDFPAVSVVSPGFSGSSFSGIGNFKNGSCIDSGIFSP
jgi:hypothetical protein